MSSDENTKQSADELPTALIRESARSGWLDAGAVPMWLLALAALAFAVGVFVTSQTNKGKPIKVAFLTGHGIKVGDSVRHRGIEVGEVEEIRLSADFDSVEVDIRLQPHAEGIAREGSRFWVQRPQVSLTQMSGLETVVGAKYIGVWPGPPGAPPADSFQGIEAPPTLSGVDDVQISIRFQNGYGIKAGHPVKHRGIVVGEVTSVDLDENLESVEASVRLVQNAKQIARVGTQFWIEHPKLGLTSIQGLDTILGGLYIAVRPGPDGSDVCNDFEGLEVPPVALQTADEGMEFVLQAPDRESLERGSPVTYRGLTVGQVLSVGLASDARHVEARLFVRQPFTQLLRTNTRFWSSGGVDFSVGPTGINVQVDSLITFAAGGVAFATPSPPGELVHTGHRYAMLPEPPGKWREWDPRIAVGSPLLSSDNELPRLQRCAMSWRARMLGISRTRRRNGWLLPLEDGRWVMPSNFAQPPITAVGNTSTLEVAGVKVTLTRTEPNLDASAQIVSLEGTDQIEIARWPLTLISDLTEPTDTVLYTGPQEPQMIVPARRVSKQDTEWLIRELPLDEDWHGAAAICQESARLVGIVVVDKTRAAIVPIAPLLQDNSSGD